MQRIHISFTGCGKVATAPGRLLPRRCVAAHVRAKAATNAIGAKRELMDVISRTSRGVNTSPSDRKAIHEVIAELKRAREGQTTTGPAQSGTWELLWTTEKETLFILERASLFGTQAGGVYQVIDTGTGTSSASCSSSSRGDEFGKTGVSGKTTNPSHSGTGGSVGTGAYLQNVITFPPEGAFIVDSSLEVAGVQRVAFRFTAARLKLPGGRVLTLPPFGKGWFDNVYLDEDLRVSCDSRGDTLVTVRVGPPRRFV